VIYLSSILGMDFEALFSNILDLKDFGGDEGKACF
jgi:hypothetical protein